MLTKDGSSHHYAGNPENPVSTFRLGRIGLISTAIYSVDGSLIRYAARGATDRLLARLHTTIALGRARASHRSRPDPPSEGAGPDEG